MADTASRGATVSAEEPIAGRIATATFWSNRRDLLQFGTGATGVHNDHILGRIVCDETIAVAWMYIAHILGTAPGIAHGQYTFEGVTEFLVENGINYWIEGRIRVAQPGKYLEGLATNAGLAKGGGNVDTKEGYPTYKEYAHYDAHSDRSLVIRYMIR